MVTRGYLGNSVWLYDSSKISYSQKFVDTTVPQVLPVSFIGTQFVNSTDETTCSFDDPVNEHNQKLHNTFKKGEIINKAAAGIISKTRRGTDIVDCLPASSDRYGHVLALNQTDNTLLLNFPSKNRANGGALYVMNLNETTSSTYPHGPTFSKMWSSLVCIIME